MKVDYDPEARSLLFEFSEFREHEEGDYTETLAGGSCIVWFHDDRPDSIQLLGADKDIAPLDEAAERFGLDAEGLRAGARAALAAPDREIRIEVGQNLADAEREAEAAAATPRSG
ncbi:MAG TPA: hypothetical protein VHS74_11835 [Solirubrobacterales bacterium]|jgi:hypothetical protein|nr:hypothetical protein [Solirubrobacterales bacterium]